MLSAEIKKVFQGGYLSVEESQAVVEKIAAEGRSEIQITVLLTLLAQRGPSVEEWTGFVQGMRAQTLSVPGGITSPVLDTCGTGGDGRHTFNVSTLSALLLAAYGIKTAKHGNRSITSQCGSADLLEGLGVKLDLPRERILPCLEKVGMVFFFAPLFHPVMKILGPLRKQMVLPTLFNSMGPLLNPIRTEYQVMGLYYSDTEKIARVLQSLGLKGGMVVHSHEGMDEISPCALTRITEFTEKDLHSYDFDPQEYGFPLVTETEVVGGDLETNLRIARTVLDPHIPLNPQKRFVLLNAAAGIRTVEGKGFQEALTIAEETLQSGAAQKKLEELIDFTNQP